MKTVFALFALALAMPVANSQDFISCGLAPGWQPSGPARNYTAENLWEYKDGAAEGYLSFGFVRLTGVGCKSGANTLDIDISEMRDPDMAYGIFSANADSSQPFTRIGMAGQVQHQSASFAKGLWYVEITEVAANPDSDDSAALLALARTLEAHLQGRTTPPDAVSWFLPEALQSVRLVPQSVLGLSELKRGYVAQYRQGQAFVVEEASPGSAAAVLRILRAKFDGTTPVSVGDEGFRANAKYLGGLCLFRKGRFLAGYTNLPDAAAAVSSALRLAPRIR